MLPSGAHLSLCICHVFSSTIGLVNVLCRIVAYVRTAYDIWNILRMREQIAKGVWEQNAGAEVRARVVILLIDGLGRHFTDLWSPTGK